MVGLGFRKHLDRPFVYAQEEDAEVEAVLFLEAWRWMFKSLVGGRKVVQGTLGCRMMVSASNQLFKRASAFRYNL